MYVVAADFGATQIHTDTPCVVLNDRVMGNEGCCALNQHTPLGVFTDGVLINRGFCPFLHYESGATVLVDGVIKYLWF